MKVVFTGWFPQSFSPLSKLLPMHGSCLLRSTASNSGSCEQEMPLERTDHPHQLRELACLVRDRHQHQQQLVQSTCHQLSHALFHLRFVSCNHQSFDQRIDTGSIRGNRKARSCKHVCIKWRFRIERDARLCRRLYGSFISTHCHRDMRDERWCGSKLSRGSCPQSRQGFIEQIGNRAYPRNRAVSNFTGQVKGLLAQCRDEQGNLCRAWDRGSHLEECSLMIHTSLP